MQAIRISLAALLMSLTVLTPLPVGTLRGADVKDHQGLKVILGDTVTITRDRRWCWFPTLQTFPDGQLLAGLWMSPDEQFPEDQFTGFCVSKDNGKTWSPRTPTGRGGHSRIGISGNKIYELGYILLPASRGETKKFLVSVTIYSEGGNVMTVCQNVPVSFPMPVAMTPPKLTETGSLAGSTIPEMAELNFDHSIVKLSNGHWIATMYGRLEGDTRSRSLLVESADEGKSWHYYSTISKFTEELSGLGERGKEGFGEPYLVRLKDQRLFCVMRTGSNSELIQTWSSDEGQNWTRPVSAGVKGVQPSLCLLDNGVLALCTGRPGPITVFFSEDGTGQNWSYHKVIFSGKSTCYTDMTQVAPNRLFIIYDNTPYGWNTIPKYDAEAYNAILGTYVDAAR